MRILLAPDSFKESLSATDVAHAMELGINRVDSAIECDLCPIADGGEGTVEALVTATGGTFHEDEVAGPLGDPVVAKWGMLGDRRTAVIEMAQAAGLHLVAKDQRDPGKTSTHGVGELIGKALDADAKTIIVGIGGSATNDGGAGMAQALGVRFDGIQERINGDMLGWIRRVDTKHRDKRLDNVTVIVACDVTNPLTGPNGASAIYGPQKGASSQQVAKLDDNLSHLARMVKSVDPDIPGAGAAGGLGYGLVAFCGGELRRGIEIVLDAVRFRDRVRNADLVLTGEGALDGQSLQGKACLGIAALAAEQNVPTIALVGKVDTSASRQLSEKLLAYFSICNGPVPLEEAMRNAAALVEATTFNVVRCVRS